MEQSSFTSDSPRTETVEILPLQRRPWAPSDGDARCQECGGGNPVWWVQHDLWNTVMGGSNGVLCPSCFIRRAEHVGLGRSGAWQLYPPAALR